MVGKREILRQIYENVKSPHSFSGVQNLLETARNHDPGITKKDVKSFLEEQDSYTLHKITRKRFTRRKVLAPKPGVIASCDLAETPALAPHNDGHKYILVFIDVFSRFAQAVPLKNKDGKSTALALQTILESGYFDNLSRLNSDEGKEFYNRHVQQLLKSRGIKLYSVYSREIKASLAERLIRTLKSKLYRYMTHNNTKRYVDVLPDVIESYNNSIHSSLGNKQTPLQVHKLTDLKAINRQFFHMYKNPSSNSNKVSSDLTIGQYVRIADEHRNSIYRRGYKVQNTIEIFKVRHVDISQNPTVYFLEDLNGDPITGVFYREELTPTQLPEYFQLDILKSKTVGGRKKYFVRWIGYPENFNSWVDQDQMVPV